MKVAVLISGGVDSSVALRLLKEQGHSVTAFYLKIWLEDELAFLGDCPWEQDLAFARKVCKQAGVELKIVPLQKEYHDRVIAYTVQAVKEGRTPNPDVLCNTMIKFGAFYEAVGKEYKRIATGHYAQVLEKEGVFYLHKTPDPIKDQTYFLSRLTQEQLARVMFPLGNYTKEQVRNLAQQFDLPNKERKDSQGLCFLGKIKFSEFIKEHIGTKQGDLVEFETGKVWGTHEGFWFYTIGQRQGIGLSHGPWYVIAKEPSKNIVYISKEYHTDEKKRDQFVIDHCYWFSGKQPDTKNLTVKIRHGKQEHKATLQDSTVKLSERDQGIAAGQFAVFYDGSLCLGSGIITKTF